MEIYQLMQKNHVKNFNTHLIKNYQDNRNRRKFPQFNKEFLLENSTVNIVFYGERVNSLMIATKPEKK